MPDAVTHPTLHELVAFGLGKLPEHAAAVVAVHLESCSACRKAVANVPPDSFLGKVRAAGPDGSSFSPSLATPNNAPSSVGRPAMPIVPCADIPPELARHPKFLILRELGRGGMGVVYQARHKEMDRQIVIKVINRKLLDRPETLERFHREIRAAALLSHPNIVTAYDAERVGDAHMLVMEFVPGMSLAEVVQKKGPLPIANACHYMRQVALGLQHAHERELVHRDIKPQNLMLTLKNQVKILDFGLAKILREERPGTGLTGHDTYMGTPDYCAPEQAIDARSADTRADLYSLGCTLYYLLSGRPPFREDTVVDTILAHELKQPQPLPELRADVPAELWQVVARLLAKEPERRYQKPIEVVQALAPFVKSGAKPEAKSDSMPIVKPPEKGTMMAANNNHIKKVLCEVPDKTPPKKVLAKAQASPFADLTDEGAVPEEFGRANRAPKRSLPTLWKRPGVQAVAMSVSLALILMVVIIIKVKVPPNNGAPGKATSSTSGTDKPKPPPAEAIVVLEIDQPDAEVTVDGQKISIHVPGDNKAIEIKVEAGQHKLRVRKDGFEVVTRDVELKSGKSAPIRVWLEPVTAAEQPKQPAPPRPTPADGFVPLFNGKDLDGWNPSPGSTWRVNESGALIGSGATPTGLFTERGDFADFHLRAEVMLGDGFNSRLLFRASGATHYGVSIAGEPGPNQFPWPTGSLFREDTGDKGLSISPKVDLQRGKWFKLEILAQGAHFKVFVDDVMVVDYTDTDNTRNQGAIGLTRRPRSVVKFRKIEIKELPGTKSSDTVDIRNGRYWEGIKTWTNVGAVFRPGTKQEISLEITQVNGREFKGVFSFQGGRQPIPVKGSFEGSTIEWTGDGARLEKYKGKIDGKNIKGDCGNGNFTMEVKEKK